MTPFDPYREWLGIEPHERPLNHYRLLGLELFDHDAERIARAAEARLDEVRKWQQGKYADESQRIVSELSQASVCLRDSRRRQAYDEQLRAQLAGTVPPSTPATIPALSQTTNTDTPPQLAQAEPAPLPAWLIPAGGMVALAIACVVMLSRANWFGGDAPPEVEPPVAIVTPPPEPAPPTQPMPNDPFAPSPPRPPQEPVLDDPFGPNPQPPKPPVVPPMPAPVDDPFAGPLPGPVGPPRPDDPFADPPKAPASPMDDPRLPGPAVLRLADVADEPTSDELDAARHFVGSKYDLVFSEKKSPLERAEAAKRMRDDALRTRDVPTRYVLFYGAMQSAGWAGEVDLLDEIFREFQKDFRLKNLGQLQLDCYCLLGLSTNLVHFAKNARRLLKLAGESEARGDNSRAQQFVRAARDIALKVGDPALVKEVFDFRLTPGPPPVADAPATTKPVASARVLEAQETLERRDDDSEANFIVGLHAILSDDWSKGLDHFRKTKKLRLDQTASQEGRVLVTGAGAIDVADRWWTAAGAPELRDDRAAEFRFKQRAAAWYKLGLAGLAPAVKKRVQTRLKEFEEEFAAELKTAPELIPAATTPGAIVRLWAIPGPPQPLNLQLPTPYYGFAYSSRNLQDLDNAARRNANSTRTRWRGFGCLTIRSREPAHVVLYFCKLKVLSTGVEYEGKDDRLPRQLQLPMGLSLIALEFDGPNSYFEIRDANDPRGSAVGHLPFQELQERLMRVPSQQGSPLQSELVKP